MRNELYSQRLSIEGMEQEGLPTRRGVAPGVMRHTVSGSGIGSTSVGNIAAMHPRRFSSVSQHLHPSLSQEQVMNDGPPFVIGPSTSMSGFVMSQPGDPVYDGYATAPRRNKKYRHRKTRKQYSLSQLEVEGGEGFQFTRAASLSPHHVVSHGASSYPHRQLYGNEATSSNGSIAFSDSAYASGRFVRWFVNNFIVLRKRNGSVLTQKSGFCKELKKQPVGQFISEVKQSS